MKSRFLLIVLLASFSAFGQEPNCFENVEHLKLMIENNSAYEPNNDKDWNKWTQSSDSILNVVYQALHNSLNCISINENDSTSFDYPAVWYYTEMKSAITEGQKAWIKTRDADAGFYYLTIRGGSAANDYYESSKRLSTIKRTEELYNMMVELWTMHGR